MIICERLAPRGVGTSSLMVHHALRNAVISLITVVALDFGAVTGGATITDGIFAWPGMGLLFFQSLEIRDYPVLLAELLLGPFEVEGCLIKHPAVAESEVIGKPDPEHTEVVKAYVVLHPGNAATPALTTELEHFVKQRLSAHAYPREIEFVDALPKTPSGKI